MPKQLNNRALPPFVPYPKALLFSALSRHARLTYLSLQLVAPFQCNTVSASVATLARVNGNLSQRTTQYALDELRQASYLTTERPAGAVAIHTLTPPHPLPFVPYPKAVSLDPNLNDHARLTYLALMSFCTFDTPTAYPSIAAIAERMGDVSRRAVQLALADLIRHRYIGRTLQPTGTSNLYTLLPLPPATDAHQPLQPMHTPPATSAPYKELKTKNKTVPTTAPRGAGNALSKAELNANFDIVRELWYPNLLPEAQAPKQILGLCCLLFSDRAVKGEYTQCRLQTPVTHEELRRYADWARAQPQNANLPNRLPTSAMVLQRQILVFRAHITPPARRVAVVPAPVIDHAAFLAEEES